MGRIRLALGLAVIAGMVTLSAQGEGDLALSLWTAARKADLFEEVFEVEVRVEGAESVPRRASNPGFPRERAPG